MLLIFSDLCVFVFFACARYGGRMEHVMEYFKTAIRALIHLSMSRARCLIWADVQVPLGQRNRAIGKLHRIEQCAICRCF